MRILYTTAVHFQRQILPRIQSKWRPRVTFGFHALCLQPLMSLNANVRALAHKRKTAESKIYRLTKTQRFQQWFPTLLQQLQLVQSGDVINIDFSD
ncbi:MAG: hypothetical protein ACD_21C00153G0001, partial [uncultured bacterium]